MRDRVSSRMADESPQQLLCGAVQSHAVCVCVCVGDRDRDQIEIRYSTLINVVDTCATAARSLHFA